MVYLYTNHDTVIHYCASEMILKMVSEAEFLVLPQTQSRAAAIYHLRWKGQKKEQTCRHPLPNNQ